MRAPEIARARGRLWSIAFLVMAALAGALAYLSLNGEPDLQLVYLPSRSVLAAALAGMLLAFLLYVLGAERRLRALSERLIGERVERERLNERELVRQELLALVAHELRSPLSAIKGFARLLADRGDDLEPDRRQRYLETIDEQADRLARLVDDLSTASQTQRGELSVTVEEVDVAAVAERLVNGFRAKWQRPIVVATSGPARALADTRRVEEVLINLVDNATKYSPADLPIAVSVHVRGSDVEVAVRDYGAGFPRARRRRFSRSSVVAAARPAPRAAGWASTSRRVSSKRRAARSDSSARRGAARDSCSRFLHCPPTPVLAESVAVTTGGLSSRSPRSDRARAAPPLARSR